MLLNSHGIKALQGSALTVNKPPTCISSNLLTSHSRALAKASVHPQKEEVERLRCEQGITRIEYYVFVAC